MPIAEQTTSPANAQPKGKIMSTFSQTASKSPPITPRMIPRIPPASEIKIASVKNCRKISRLRAPIDLRTPISFVRSVTLTSMMFMMPMPAATSAMKLITNAPMRTTPAIEANALLSESFE